MTSHSVFSQIIASIALSLSLLGSSLFTIMPDKDMQDTLFVVNYASKISEDFAPDVVQANVKGYSSRYLRNDAAEALQTMFADAQKEGISLFAVSGYRPYYKQQLIYNRKVQKTNKDQQLVAVPGTSEHQMGLAIDVASPSYMNLNAGFAKTKSGKWLAKNCYKYGFIIRYPESFESITRIKFEPWHLRYVGKEHSLNIQNKDFIPLEYYVSEHRLNVYKELLDFEN